MMESAYRFFRKYLLATALILMLFFVVNVFLVFGVLLFAENKSSAPDISIESIRDGIHLQSDGSIIADDFTYNTLRQKKAWAMILDNDGMVCWQLDMPEYLPTKYTPTDIAKFSRWYLNDYPTYVYEHPAGLLVIGCAPDSLVKWNFSLDSRYITTLLFGPLFVIAANLLLFLILLWRNTRKVERAVSPILYGIEQISEGKEVLLPKRGELAEINEKLNKAGEHLLKKERARAEWINGISHDVRTPLSYILGYAGKLENNPSLPAEVRDQAGTIRIQSEKLRRLIADLNLCSKLEYSMQPLSMKSVDLLELVRQVIVQTLESGLDEQYSIDLQADARTSYLVQGDTSLLTRLLENLIGNSIMHNQKGCKISVIVSTEKDMCTLSVIDDGKGTSSETIQRLNDHNFTASLYQTNGESAHGIGLRLVCQIVKAHHGRVQFSNLDPHGFEAIIEFPISQ